MINDNAIPLLRMTDVAERLSVSLGRAYELARLGRIPVVRLTGRQLRVDRVQLEEWIKQGGRVHDVRAGLVARGDHGDHGDHGSDGRCRRANLRTSSVRS